MGNYNQSSRDGRCEQYKKEKFCCCTSNLIFACISGMKIQTAHIVEVKALSYQNWGWNLNWIESYLDKVLKKSYCEWLRKKKVDVKSEVRKWDQQAIFFLLMWCDHALGRGLNWSLWDSVVVDK